METNLDSVLDRIRILEDKMEQGIPMVPPAGPMQGAGIASGYPGGAGAPGAEGYPGFTGYPGSGNYAGNYPGTAGETAAPKPEKAAPEDLQKVKNNWRSIVGQTEGMFKSFLSTAVPKYNGNTGENKLFVEFTNDMAQRCVEDPGKKELLEAIIAGQIGKSVEVELVLKKGNTQQNLADISVDDILKQTVHADIVIEEEPDEDEL